MVCFQAAYIVHDTVHLSYDFCLLIIMKVTFDTFFVRFDVIVCKCFLHFCPMFCLYWLSRMLFPVAVLVGTHGCHVPVHPFCSLDWHSCLSRVSLLFFSVVVFCSLESELIWEYHCAISFEMRESVYFFINYLHLRVLWFLPPRRRNVCLSSRRTESYFPSSNSFWTLWNGLCVFNKFSWGNDSLPSTCSLAFSLI